MGVSAGHRHCDAGRASGSCGDVRGDPGRAERVGRKALDADYSIYEGFEAPASPDVYRKKPSCSESISYMRQTRRSAPPGKADETVVQAGAMMMAQASEKLAGIIAARFTLSWKMSGRA